MCLLKGVVLYYPQQNEDDIPKPYPWAIVMRGKNPAVFAVEMLNPYNGIDSTKNERHLIRYVHGQPIRRGILVDAIYGESINMGCFNLSVSVGAEAVYPVFVGVY